MQSDEKFSPAKPTSPVAGAYASNKLAVPPTNATPGVGDGIGLNVTKPPKSFIIFDQTENKCRIMFYPGCSNKFDYPNQWTTNTLGNYSKEDAGKESSSFKEDTKDIDALLSIEDEEEDGDEDDEEVSTGRTMGNISGGSSPDSSYSTDGSASCKTRLSSLHNFSSISGSSSERKRKKMKKLIKALREIVPGGDRLDAAAVLDESVTYLKSLKMEVMKLGMKNVKN